MGGKRIQVLMISFLACFGENTPIERQRDMDKFTRLRLAINSPVQFSTRSVKWS
jgi:hypothetical protein